MPSALFYQPGSGISGDMHLAALVDLGVPETWLREQLARLPVAAEYTLTVQRAAKMGIDGTQIHITTTDSHDHRHHSTIVKMIKQAGFSPGVERRALAIFSAIANAEGKIHNIPPEQVHFHEVGAVDSIIDIVGAALCIDYLQPDIVLCNPVEVGSGHVDCAHGRFPVPAPATQELLQGAPCTYGGVVGEATTPTGAAILAASVDEYLPRQSFTPQRIGYGIGHKDFTLPNVLRVVVGEYQQAHHTQSQIQYKVEANIDDMTPEAYAPLMDALFSAGALDVYIMPIMMKKNRPANCITALCDEPTRQQVCDTLLNASATIGLRILPFEKVELPRQLLSLQTTMGEVTVKQVTQPDGRTRWKSEHTDILRISEQHQRDYQSVKQQLDVEISQLLTSRDS